MASRSKRRPAHRSQEGRPQSPSLWRRGKWLFIAGGVAGSIALLVALTYAFSGPEATGGLSPVPIPPSQGSGGALSSARPAPAPIPPSQGSGGAVSSSLPNFALALYQGEEILGSQKLHFHDLLGKQPLVLNFWASNCPPCTAEMPEFEKIWRKYKDRVLFLGLDVGQFAGLGGPEDSRRALRDLSITYPAAPAPDIAALEGLQVRALPSTYFITPDGNIYKQWVGILNKTKLTELVEDLLKTP